MKEHIERRSKKAGFNESILPTFNAEERRDLKGAIDYLGLNNYGDVIVSAAKSDSDSLTWDANMEVTQLGSHLVSNTFSLPDRHITRFIL